MNHVGETHKHFWACLLGLCLSGAGWAQTVELDIPEAGDYPSQPMVRGGQLAESVVLDDYGDNVFVDEGWGGGACASCGGEFTGGQCSSCGGCMRSNCYYFDRFWVSAEYLIWWTKGMSTPPLVTTSPVPTDQNQAGVLGQPGTQVLVGDQGFFTDVRNGARFRGGVWMDHCHTSGLEAEYFFLGDEAEHFRNASNGSQIIARPFFNVLTGRQDSELVSFPDVVRGEALVDATTSLQSAGLRAVINLCCQQWCADGCVNGCPTTVPASQRWDLLVGYRYTDLDETLAIREGLVSLLPQPDDGTFDIRDRFETRNVFNGVDLGLRGTWTRTRWGVDLLAKCALGTNRQFVRIDGSTITTVNGVGLPQVGGLLAQPTNIGEYSRNQFAAIPEFGATVDYQVSQRLRVSLGYSLIYWFDVVRPGDQIDLRVNPNLLPPAMLPLQGEAAPLFAFQESSLWLQGISLGGELRW